MTLKTLKDILKDADKLLSKRSFPIVFLDTSAVIDICKSSRNEKLKQNSKREKLPWHEIYIDHFLMNFASKYETIISPLTYSEIKDHYKVKCNSHSWEIDKGVYFLMRKFFEDYKRLKNFCNIPPDDKERYDVYWATKLCCSDNKKKNLEGFSEVDREILTDALLFSEYFMKDNEKADPVVIFSSDEHILKGVGMLNKLMYENLFSLSTRKNEK